VTAPPDLSKLSHADKDRLILALIAQLAAARETMATQETRIAALEARIEELTRPPKTPDNSSKPPSQGQKQDRAGPGADRPPRKSRPGVGRTLHPNPDRLRAVAIGRRRATLKDTTLKQYLGDLDRRLDRIMAAVPIGEPGRKLRKRMVANRAHLFVFMTHRDVP
jgi:hypothetical protein